MLTGKGKRHKTKVVELLGIINEPFFKRVDNLNT